MIGGPAPIVPSLCMPPIPGAVPLPSGAEMASFFFEDRDVDTAGGALPLVSSALAISASCVPALLVFMPALECRRWRFGATVAVAREGGALFVLGIAVGLGGAAAIATTPLLETPVTEGP